MTKYNQNTTMISGDTHKLVVTTTFTSTGVDLNNIDKVKWKLDLNSITINKSSTGADITIDSTSQMTVTINSSETEDYSGQFNHEAEIIDASNNVSTVMKGKISILEDTITT